MLTVRSSVLWNSAIVRFFLIELVLFSQTSGQFTKLSSYSAIWEPNVMFQVCHWKFHIDYCERGWYANVQIITLICSFIICQWNIIVPNVSNFPQIWRTERIINYKVKHLNTFDCFGYFISMNSKIVVISTLINNLLPSCVRIHIFSLRVIHVISLKLVIELMYRRTIFLPFFALP